MTWAFAAVNCSYHKLFAAQAASRVSHAGSASKTCAFAIENGSNEKLFEVLACNAERWLREFNVQVVPNGMGICTSEL
jgi:hypothetical protein